MDDAGARVFTSFRGHSLTAGGVKAASGMLAAARRAKGKQEARKRRQELKELDIGETVVTPEVLSQIRRNQLMSEERARRKAKYLKVVTSSRKWYYDDGSVNVPVWRRGDPSLYKPRPLAARGRALVAKGLLRIIKLWWVAFSKRPEKKAMKGRATHLQPNQHRSVHEKSYKAMHGWMYKVLVEPYDEKEAARCAELEWRRDSRGSPTIAFPVFFQCLFETADTWTDGTTVREYVEFLRGLLQRVLKMKSEAERGGDEEELENDRDVLATLAALDISSEDESDGKDEANGNAPPPTLTDLEAYRKHAAAPVKPTHAAFVPKFLSVSTNPMLDKDFFLPGELELVERELAGEETDFQKNDYLYYQKPDEDYTDYTKTIKKPKRKRKKKKGAKGGKPSVYRVRNHRAKQHEFQAALPYFARTNKVPKAARQRSVSPQGKLPRSSARPRFRARKWKRPKPRGSFKVDEDDADDSSRSSGSSADEKDGEESDGAKALRSASGALRRAKSLGKDRLQYKADFAPSIDAVTIELLDADEQVTASRVHEDGVNRPPDDAPGFNDALVLVTIIGRNLQGPDFVSINKGTFTSFLDDEWYPGQDRVRLHIGLRHLRERNTIGITVNYIASLPFRVRFDDGARPEIFSIDEKLGVNEEGHLVVRGRNLDKHTVVCIDGVAYTDTRVIGKDTLLVKADLPTPEDLACVGPERLNLGTGEVVSAVTVRRLRPGRTTLESRVMHMAFQFMQGPSPIFSTYSEAIPQIHDAAPKPWEEKERSSLVVGTIRGTVGGGFFLRHAGGYASGHETDEEQQSRRSALERYMYGVGDGADEDDWDDDRGVAVARDGRVVSTRFRLPTPRGNLYPPPFQDTAPTSSEEHVFSVVHTNAMPPRGPIRPVDRIAPPSSDDGYGSSDGAAAASSGGDATDPEVDAERLRLLDRMEREKETRAERRWRNRKRDERLMRLSGTDRLHPMDDGETVPTLADRDATEFFGPVRFALEEHLHIEAPQTRGLHNSPFPDRMPQPVMERARAELLGGQSWKDIVIASARRDEEEEKLTRSLLRGHAPDAAASGDGPGDDGGEAVDDETRRRAILRQRVRARLDPDATTTHGRRPSLHNPFFASLTPGGSKMIAQASADAQLAQEKAAARAKAERELQRRVAAEATREQLAMRRRDIDLAASAEQIGIPGTYKFQDVAVPPVSLGRRVETIVRPPDGPSSARAATTPRRRAVVEPATSISRPERMSSAELRSAVEEATARSRVAAAQRARRARPRPASRAAAALTKLPERGPLTQQLPRTLKHWIRTSGKSEP